MKMISPYTLYNIVSKKIQKMSKYKPPSKVKIETFPVLYTKKNLKKMSL